MIWIIASLVLALCGTMALAALLRFADVESDAALQTAPADQNMDEVWQREPLQTFMHQVQVARYWQPPFRRR